MSAYPVVLESTSRLLSRLGYELEFFKEPREEPEKTSIKFKEIINEFANGVGRAKSIADKVLYTHQAEAYNALSNGENLVLISGTGSGKTEAWILYAIKHRVKTLVVYPTLALSQDQIERIEDYYASLGLDDRVLEIDRPEIERLGGPSKAAEKASSALLVVTNPAFLMADVKRMAEPYIRGRKGVLDEFLRRVDLIVIDELDFYGSHGATLLLSIIELVVRYCTSKKPQVAVLTATLGNPEELASYLTSLNNRQTRIIRGRAFKPENHVYLVLGKNLRKTWELLRDKRREVVEKAPELLEFLDNYDLFRDRAYLVMELLEASGIKIPWPGIDFVEILAEYAMVDEKGVTIVFTPSIRSAENYAKKLKARLVEEYGLPKNIVDEAIATHHHLISSERRKLIEEKLRSGDIRIVFTVRTLLQGVDMPSIARIVHYGLPVDVREYKQREGRKGRREIAFTETIIIPVTPWNRRLLENGVEGLREYTSMPLENIIINTRNKYVILFKSLFKVLKTRGEDLTEEEEELLREYRLINYRPTLHGRAVFLTDKGRIVWRNLNFYEYGPPYGVAKILVKPDGSKERIGDVSRRDFVEKYQPGCFDYSSDTVVVSASSRSIVLEDIAYAIRNVGFLSDAWQAYYNLKLKMGEEPDILGDYYSGRLTSNVVAYVRVPRKGFGEVVEEPAEVYWVIEAKKPRLIRREDGYTIIYPREKILLDAPTSGRYIDYSYGYSYELDPRENIDAIRAGLASLLVFLRLSSMRISLTELRYAVEEAPMKRFYIWESESIGLLELIDWRELVKELRKYTPPSIFNNLLWAVDSDAALWISLKGLGWDKLRELVLRALDYIMGVHRISIRGYGELYIPKPSPEQRLVAMALMKYSMEDEKYLVGLFDGREGRVIEVRLSDAGGEDVRRLVEVMSRYIDKDYKILHYASDEDLWKLAENSLTLRLLVEKIIDKRILVDVHEEAKRILGVEKAPLGDVLAALGLSGMERYIDSIDLKKIASGNAKLLEKIKTMIAGRARSIYMLYLVLREIEKSRP